MEEMQQREGFAFIDRCCVAPTPASLLRPSPRPYSPSTAPSCYGQLANHSLLIPLNICRHKTDYLPWKCEDERHVYEKCQYDE